MKTIFNFIKKNRNIILLIISFVFLTMLILGMTYAYFDLKTGGETESTMNIGGAEISATYVYSNSINITDALPGNGIIASKDITLTYKNTSSDEYKVYLKAVIDYNTFTKEENGGVLKYEIKSGNDTIQTQIKFPTIKYGKKTLAEIPIPANSNGTLKYTINFYFPESNQLQNPDGQLILNASLSVESDDSSNYSINLLKKIDLMYQYESETNGIEQDNTSEENIRYVGASPYNYLKFNDETWRIIGIFNKITSIDEQGKEKTESLVKIVRDESLGNYSWDSSESTINNGQGINEWSQADLMYELNCDGSGSTKYCRNDITNGYLSDLTNGTTSWYNSGENDKNASYDYSKNIKSSWVDKIANVRWNLGGYDTTSGSALNMYNVEREKLHISNPTDGVIRTNTWDGKIALMYPSDYGYASTGTECRSNLDNCDDADSKANNWLFNSADQWTLSPRSSFGTAVFSVYLGGYVTNIYVASIGFGVRPALFLKSDVVIVGGTGTESDPFIIN